MWITADRRDRVLTKCRIVDWSTLGIPVATWTELRQILQAASRSTSEQIFAAQNLALPLHLPLHANAGQINHKKDYRLVLCSIKAVASFVSQDHILQAHNGLEMVTRRVTLEAEICERPRLLFGYV